MNHGEAADGLLNPAQKLPELLHNPFGILTWRHVFRPQSYLSLRRGESVDDVDQPEECGLQQTCDRPLFLILRSHRHRWSIAVRNVYIRRSAFA